MSDAYRTAHIDQIVAAIGELLHIEPTDDTHKIGVYLQGMVEAMPPHPHPATIWNVYQAVRESVDILGRVLVTPHLEDPE